MNAPNGIIAALDRAIARNLERGAANGSPSDLDLRNVREVVTELYEALAGISNALEDVIPTLAGRGWQTHNEEAMVRRARAALARAIA